MHFAAQRKFLILIRELVELVEHTAHARIVDRVQPIRRRSDRCKTDFMETQIVC